MFKCTGARLVSADLPTGASPQSDASRLPLLDARDVAYWHKCEDVAFSACPVCAANRTWIEHAPSSQKCQIRTFTNGLLDRLLGAYEQGLSEALDLL